MISKKNSIALEDIFGKGAHSNYKIQLLVSMLDNIQEIILVIDNNAKIIFVNEGYCRMYNITREKIVGRVLHDIEPNARIIEVLKTGKTILDDPSYIVSLGIDVIANMSPIFHRDKQIGAIASMKNVSEIRLLNNQIEHLKKITQFLTNKNDENVTLPPAFNAIVGKSKQLYAVKKKASKVAPTNATVLITGESGVGKEVFTEAMHYSSLKSNGPFKKINCAAIPEPLLESELFGYDTGAFTGAKVGGKKGKFEEANGGTLFLDEIGDLSLPMQAKILRVLQQKEIERIGGNKLTKIDVRIITATNKNLHEMVNNGLFREDLYYRIAVVKLCIPPLRSRKDDIVTLSNYFLEHENMSYNKQLTFSRDVINAFLNYSWPGNVRELKNTIEHAAIICPDELIQLEHLPETFFVDGSAIKFNLQFDHKLSEMLNKLEKEAIISALSNAKNNRTKAINLLGLSRRAFYQKLKKYGLD